MRIFGRRRPHAVDYRLGNAELRQAEAPRTFFIPSALERGSLENGDFAKLIFEVVDPTGHMPSAERMWVKVVDVVAGRYVGVLDNEPGVITTAALGSPIEFGPEHVIAIPDDWDLLAKKVFVSRRSQVDDVRPGYVYREQPDSDADSGWRALVGDETDDEINDADNLLVQQVGFLLDRWPDLRPLFESEPDEGSWEWNNATQTYVEAAGAS